MPHLMKIHDFSGQSMPFVLTINDMRTKLQGKASQCNKIVDIDVE